MRLAGLLFCLFSTVSAYSNEDLELRTIENKLIEAVDVKEIPSLMQGRAEILTTQITGWDRSEERLRAALSAVRDFSRLESLWKSLSEGESLDESLLDWESSKATIKNLQLLVEDMYARKIFRWIPTDKNKQETISQKSRLIANEFPESSVCREQKINCDKFIDPQWAPEKEGFAIFSYFSSSHYAQFLLTSYGMATNNSKLIKKYLPVLVLSPEFPTFKTALHWSRTVCQKSGNDFSICDTEGSQKYKNETAVKEKFADKNYLSVSKMPKGESDTIDFLRIRSLLRLGAVGEGVNDYVQLMCQRVVNRNSPCDVKEAIDHVNLLKYANNPDYQALEWDLAQFYVEGNKQFLPAFQIIENMYETMLSFPRELPNRTFLRTWPQINYFLVAHAVYNEQNLEKARHLYQSTTPENPLLPDMWAQKAKALGTPFLIR